MNKKLLSTIVPVIIGIGVYFWWFSDTKVIKRQAEDLIECFEKDNNDGRFGGVLATTNLKELLHENIDFQYEGEMPYSSLLAGGNISKDTLIQAHGALVNSAGIVTITNKKIIVTDVKDHEADVDLSFHIKTQKIAENFDQNIDCQLIFKKVKGDWKISSAIIK